MTTRAEQARIFNESIAQGLTEDQAIAAAGITDTNLFSYGINGQLEPAVIGPPRRENETIVPPGTLIDEDDDFQFTAGSVTSQSTTTTTQTTVTGGGSTTTVVQPTQFQDTAASREAQATADSLAAQKRELSAQLKAQGKTGAQVLADPRYRELSRQQQSAQTAAEAAKIPIPGTGGITQTSTPSTTTTTTFQSSAPVFITSNAGIEDTQVQTQQINRTPAATPLTGIVTLPQDDPAASEAEARAFLAQQNSRVANPEPDPGFTYYGAPAVAPAGPPRSTATVNPNPWAGIDAEKAAAWARLSPADQRWLGNGDPTDEFILRRAPNGGRPQAAINSVQETAPAPLPDDNLAFDPLPDDNLAYTQGVNPGAGYTTTYDEFGNEIPVRQTLPDDNLAYTQGLDNTAGYSFEDTGGVPTQRLSDFTVQDTAGYSFEDTGGVPTQRLSDFTVDPGPEYPVADDNLGFEQLPDDNLAYTDGTDPGPGYGVSDDNLGFEQLPDDNLAFQDTEVEDTEGYIVADGAIDVPEGQQEFAPTALGGNFSAQYDVESGTYGVFDEDTGQFVQTGLTEQEATLLAQDASIGDPNFAGNADAASDTGVADVPPADIAFEPTALGGDFVAAFDPETGTWGVFDNDTGVFVETGLTEQEATLKAQEYSVGDPNFAGNPDAATDPGLTPEQAAAQAEAQAQAAAAEAAIAQAAAARKAAQEAVAQQRKQADQGDWRVKLRLAGGADYLYRAPENQVETGILYPLYVSNGVIFPYTPTITTNYGATYSSYDLTHSNFRGYFYQNSFVDEVTIQAVFTAQDTTEANYLLAVIHFFRSVTKMFYGQDANRGQPPPLVFLQGLGEFQFNLHPCLVRSFTYNMPNDVDYIRARTANFDGTSLLKRRDRQSQSLDSYSASNTRLDAAGLTQGAGSGGQQTVPTLGTNRPTYVPTRMEATITLLPMQTRQQVSQEFSLRRFSSGELVKQGYW